jgi:predicted transcriptional regulator
MPMTITLSADQIELLQRLADKHRRSKSSMIGIMILERCEAEGIERPIPPPDAPSDETC